MTTRRRHYAKIVELTRMDLPPSAIAERLSTSRSNVTRLQGIARANGDLPKLEIKAAPKDWQQQVLVDFEAGMTLGAMRRLYNVSETTIGQFLKETFGDRQSLTKIKGSAPPKEREALAPQLGIVVGKTVEIITTGGRGVRDSVNRISLSGGIAKS